MSWTPPRASFRQTWTSPKLLPERKRVTHPLIGLSKVELPGLKVGIALPQFGVLLVSRVSEHSKEMLVAPHAAGVLWWG